MKNIIISSCLLGENVRYNGEAVDISEGVSVLSDEYNIIPVCPEVLGGLSVPREPCEIVNGTGIDVLNGCARVMGSKGADCTEAFLKGAEIVLSIAKEHKAELAVMKERSPSCGSSRIYSGEFNGNKKPGQGVTSALLQMSGIKVISEEVI
ncbi:MAG: DUF523 domain-containing protein [Denitrovibrio sp.]|nr:MAG: DUF523 domain-containing protein [Denitrovibrio sp.]